MNAVQEEPSNVIEAAGLTLDKADNTQLLQALNILYQTPIDQKMPLALVDISNTDLDFLVTNGRFNGANLTNSPDGSADWFYVEVMVHSGFEAVTGEYVCQRGTNLYTGAMYVRVETAPATWSAWQSLSSAAASSVPAGFTYDFAGTVAPVGYLALPIAPSDADRTVYADLFAAIGTTWGVGDGSTTFGLPYCPANYAAVQANGNVGTGTVGDVIAHTHTGSAAHARLSINNINATWMGSGGEGTSGSVTTNATGGAANLAAGIRLLKCIKYTNA
jgi:microcystin-dependent protein